MPFVKGKSGNPKGRPKGVSSMTDLWKSAAAEVDPITKRTKYAMFIDKVIEKALAGDAKANYRRRI